MSEDFVPDLRRAARIGLPEAVFCLDKSPEQIAAILAAAPERLLLTRLESAKFDALPPEARERVTFDPGSRTAFLGAPVPAAGPVRVAVVTAGTSDLPMAMEAVRTLAFHGQDALRVADVGVAGLWRLLGRMEELRTLPVLIVAAGMDAALPSVLAGLVPGVVIALPTSTGYGVAAGGVTALHAALASCAPGVTVVNIDNGYGAACAALRVLRAIGSQPAN